MRLRVKKGDEEPSTSAHNRSPLSRVGHLPPSPTSSRSSPKRSPGSPISPIGRVAKRNARLLNGLDLGPRAGGYSEHLVGTIPDFSIRSLQEVCPAVGQALEAVESGDAHGLDDSLLTDLQFQLENLLADNVDWQKNIFGEMTFLASGDYPTDDLRSRLMPSYELRSDNSIANHMDVDDPQPSISYIDHCKQDEDDVGSDAISSMDEKEADEPYCVLDIPHRFWTWAREYVGHIDEKFLREFDQNFYRRYQSNQMEECFLNEPFKYKPVKNNNSSLSNHSKHLNGIHKSDSNGRKLSKISIASTSNGLNGNHHEEESGEEDERVTKSSRVKKRPSIQAARDSFFKSLKSEDTPGDLMKRLVAAYVDEQTSSASKNGKPRGRKPFMKAVIPPKLPVVETKKKRQLKGGEKVNKRKNKTKKMNGEINGKVNGHLHGVESTDDESHNELLTKTDLMESIGQALADCVMPLSAAVGNELDQEMETEEDEEEESEADEPESSQDDSVAFSNNMENFELIKLKLDSKHSISDLDEVSTELLKAQQKLEQLVKKTSPILNKCKKELEAEHAYWVTTRAINSIDDELFRLTNQIPNGATNPPEELFKHCLDLWEQRKRLLLNHYIRDHVKFVQHAEKTNSDAQKIEAVMGTRTPEKRLGESSLEQGTKTRSNRKKSSAVKKELHIETLEE